jgi:hypothetical protein
VDAMLAALREPFVKLVPAFDVDRGLVVVFEAGERGEDLPRLLGGVVGDE